MSKTYVVEKFSYLKDVGEGLLHRLYSSRYFFGNDKSRPHWLKEPAGQKIVKSLIAKFPEFPDTDKMQGYEVLTTKAKVISDDLEQHYETFVDCSEWKDAAHLLLIEVANASISLKLDENPVLTTLWLDLMVLYVRLHVLASTIPDRKLALAVYYKMFYHIRSAAEPHYQKAAKWAFDFDSPFRKIQDEFKVINDAMGKVLVSLMMPYMKIRFINTLRKEGALNITLKPEELVKPAMDQARIELALASKMYLWIVYGFICTPGAFALQGSVELAKFALSEGYLTPVFKEISVPLYPEYAYLFNNYKSKTLNLSKQKKIIKEAATASVTEASRRHLERRVYVRQELEALYHLFRDKPALLGPKIQILWAALSLAKEEIFWYFRHLDTMPPEKLKKAYKAEDFRDKRISSLIHLVDVIVAFVNIHRRIIITYYLEYMCGADLASLTNLMDSSFIAAAGPTNAQYANSILSDLQGINVDQWNSGNGHIPSFVNLRENWLRLELAMSTPGSTAPIQKFKNLSHRMTMVYAHSRNVDSLDEMFDDYSNLRALWYYKDAIFGIPAPPPAPGSQPTQGTPGLFDALITDGPDQPLHAMSFLRLLALFPLNATQYWPEERELIGNEVVNIANTCLSRLATRVVTILNTVATIYIQAEYQLSDANAALPLLQKRKEWKPPHKDWTPPAEPGSESAFRNRPNLDTLRLYQRNAAQLCTALNELLEIVIYDQVFVPREFLREKMAQTLRQFIRKAAVVSSTPEVVIQRPSILELQVRVYTTVFGTVENFLDLDVGDLVREVLLGESYAKPLGKLGKVDWFPEGEIDYEGGVGGVLANWYSEFIAKKLTAGVCYSPLRLGFVARAGVALRADEYADIVELKALARMVGPYGVKLIERELLKFILANVGPLRDVVVLNVSALEEILANFHKEAKCMESTRKLRDLDNFISRSISIGNALAFRRLLKAALNEVAHDEIPYIVSAVDSMFNQYPPNTFMFPDLLLTDTLAMDLGLNQSTSDQALKVVLKKATSEADKKLWELLPVLYACSFTSSYWREAQFRPHLEGHLNNCHSLVYCINDLITAFASITFASSGNVEDIAALQLRYVEIASVILLRMARLPQRDKHGPVDFASVVIFIDRFVQECPLLTEDMLERTLPYTLLRNMYKQLYEDKLGPGGKPVVGEGSQDSGF